MSQTQSDNKHVSSKPGKALPKHITITLIVLTVLSLLMVGYSELSHVTTVTQQQFVTNTQIVVSSYTVVSVGTQTVTSVTTLTDTNVPAGYYQYCNV
jgi:hypothetical protein